MEAALLTGLSVVLYICGSLPVVGMVLIFLTPVPLVILEMRHDLRIGFLALTVGALLALLVEGPLSAISYSLGFAMLGLALGRIIELRRTAVEILGWGSLVSLACKLILAVIMFYVTGLNPMNLDMTGMQKVMDLALKLPGGTENAESVKTMMETTMKIVPLVVPAVFILVSVVDCTICYLISSRVIKRLSHEELPSLPPFVQWRFPLSVLWAFLVALGCLVIGSRDPERFAFLTRIGLNLQILVQYLFILQGMSLVAWWMENMGLSKGLRIPVLVVLFIFPLMSTMTTYVGIIDMCWNVRARIGGDRS